MVQSAASTMNWRSLIALLLIHSANAAEWEQSLATVPALRTGGASLVSSDAIEIEGRRYALITYWETRSGDDLDFYRCVDIADSTFATVRQNCWKALRPTGRGPTTVSDVTSSDDICGRPDGASNAGNVAFCTFSRPFNLSTPYFEIALSPFENGGLVAVREQGRHLIVIDEDLPASVLLNVRAGILGDEPELSRISATNDFVANPPEGFQCAIETFSGREWAVCRQDGFPTNVVQYFIEEGEVYQVGFNTDLSEDDLAVVRATILSLRLGSR
jgi:hypothetical protein